MGRIPDATTSTYCQRARPDGEATSACLAVAAQSLPSEGQITHCLSSTLSIPPLYAPLLLQRFKVPVPKQSLAIGHMTGCKEEATGTSSCIFRLDPPLPCSNMAAVSSGYSPQKRPFTQTLWPGIGLPPQMVRSMRHSIMKQSLQRTF